MALSHNFRDFFPGPSREFLKVADEFVLVPLNKTEVIERGRREFSRLPAFHNFSAPMFFKFFHGIPLVLRDDVSVHHIRPKNPLSSAPALCLATTVPAS
jgi:hypothetical protein